jgi:ligand-binding sensor domain-containing protein
VSIAVLSNIDELQVGHDSWTFKEGAPTNVEALAQTSDGFLWLGTSGGLFRFDGVRFEAFNSPSAIDSSPTASAHCLRQRQAVFGIGYLFGGFSFINNGRIKNYSSDPASPTGTVNTLASRP